jgi:hypothetical protein
LQDCVPIFQHIEIPKSKDAVAFGSEPTIACGIFGRLGMLAAIELNNQPPVVTDKIHNETSNRRLPTETQPVQPMRTKRRPQTHFSICHLMT